MKYDAVHYLFFIKYLFFKIFLSSEIIKVKNEVLNDLYFQYYLFLNRLFTIESKNRYTTSLSFHRLFFKS